MATESVRMLEFVGLSSFAIALLQFVMYVGGRPVYFACGTPDSWIGLRERWPKAAFLVEVGLALLFATFAMYAFSGAGGISPLPLLPYGLAATAGIYLGRGILLIPQAFGRCIYTIPGRDRLYSTMSAGIGAACGFVTYRHWPELVQRASLQ